MDDMHAYFERRQHDEVQDGARRDAAARRHRQPAATGDDIRKENGMSIAQCEFWSDTLDRWADDLVDPRNGGT